MRRGPSSPIFRPEPRRGQIRVGTAIGEPPVVACMLVPGFVGSVQNAALLDGTQYLAKGGDIVYVTAQSGFDHVVSVDVSDPTTPVVLDSLLSYTLTTGTAAGGQIVFDGTYLMVGVSTGIVTLDPADPKMTILAAYADNNITTVPNGMMLVGSLLYVCGQSNSRFTILDVSDPLNITSVGSLSNPANINNINDVVVVGNYAFCTASGSNQFVVIDVSNPAAPSLGPVLSGNPSYTGAAGIAISGNYAFVGRSSGLTVVDITTPTSPSTVTTVSGGGNSQKLLIDGNYLYQTTSSGLRVWDVTTPASPSSVGTYNPGAGMRAIAKSGNNLFIADSAGVARVVDVSTPSSPTLIGSVSDSVRLDVAQGLVLDGTDLYVSGNNVVTSVDVSTPASPTLGWTTYGDILDANSQMAVDGNYLYVMAPTQGLVTGSVAVVDITDPTDIEVVAYLKHANLANCSRVAIDGDYLFCTANAGDRLTVVDVSTPTSPAYVTTLVDSTNLDGAAGIAIQGSYAYIACQSGDRVTVVDITTPASPSVVGSVTNIQLDTATGIAVSGSYAYVACVTPRRLTVVDVSTPSSPTIAGSVTSLLLASANAVAYDGVREACYVSASATDRVTVVDVSDPTTPTITGSLADSTNLDQMNALLWDAGEELLYATASFADRLTVVDVSCVPGVAPTVTINQGASQVSPTSLAVVFDVVFSEAVTGFATGSVLFTGSTAGGTMTGTVAGSGTTYTVTVTGQTTSGTIVASIPAGAAASASTGIASEASTSTDNSIDWVRPLIGTVTNATTLDQVQNVIVDGDYAYLTSNQTDRLTVVDVSDPTAPTVVGNRVSATDLDAANGLAKSGNYVFVACGLDDLMSSNDVSTPASPALGSTVADGTNLTNLVDVDIGGNYAFTVGQATGDDRLTSVDITNPLSMTVVSSIQDNLFVIPRQITVDGNYAYVLGDDTSRTLSIVDISNPASMSVVGQFTDNTNLGNSLAMWKDGDVVYCQTSANIVSVDVSTPAAPALLDVLSGFASSRGRGIVKIGDRIYSGNSATAVTLVDATDPSDMSILGTYTDATNLNGLNGMWTDGTYAYCAVSTADRLTILQFVD